jgi:TetR/AcrR family transcriptional repressor of nem operon
MRVTREQAAKTRRRIIDVAGRLFRERGFDGVGVADLMRGAGLTHGGFYGHFDSKEHLIAEATAGVGTRATERWAKVAAEHPEGPLAAVAAGYLSDKHVGHPGQGCWMAATGADLSRQPSAVRKGVAAGVRGFLDMLAGLTPGRSAAVRRERAMAAYASWVGAIVLARAVDDPALAKEILDAVAAAVPGGGVERR